MHREIKKWSDKEKAWTAKKNQWKINDTIRLAEKFSQDPEKEKRTEKQMCRLCNYQSRVALQAFWDTKCASCEKKITHHNSDINTLCFICAVENNACVHCGGEMD